ncbi:hypothetical protein [Roseococcus sp.]|uniref:hypothetical protein n=1 Tax=Roseococcus sp. TaxID=2109646 RepID=UPI003BAB2179
MSLKVVGFDPSLTHWGIAEAELDMQTGYLSTPRLRVIEPTKINHKQVRQNSEDLHVAEQLADAAFRTGREADVAFVEVPVGSQSARAMCSYGICVGILAALRSEGVQIIEVTASEVKLALSGMKNATKTQQIEAAVALYPDSEWPRHTQNGKGYKKGDLQSRAEHVADAVGAIHAGVLTPTFKNLHRLYGAREREPHANHTRPG